MSESPKLKSCATLITDDVQSLLNAFDVILFGTFESLTVMENNSIVDGPLNFSLQPEITETLKPMCNISTSFFEDGTLALYKDFKKETLETTATPEIVFEFDHSGLDYLQDLIYFTDSDETFEFNNLEIINSFGSASTFNDMIESADIKAGASSSGNIQDPKTASSYFDPLSTLCPTDSNFSGAPSFKSILKMTQTNFNSGSEANINSISPITTVVSFSSRVHI